MKEVLPWLVRWACCAGTREFCPFLAAQFKYFLPRRTHCFNSVVPIAQQAGQAVVLGRMSLSMCLWTREKMFDIPYFFQAVRYLQAGNGLQKTARRESEGGRRIYGINWYRKSGLQVRRWILFGPCLFI
jgi:hypothetical protein